MAAGPLAKVWKPRIPLLLVAIGMSLIVATTVLAISEAQTNARLLSRCDATAQQDYAQALSADPYAAGTSAYAAYASTAVNNYATSLSECQYAFQVNGSADQESGLLWVALGAFYTGLGVAWMRSSSRLGAGPASAPAVPPPSS